MTGGSAQTEVPHDRRHDDHVHPPRTGGFRHDGSARPVGADRSGADGRGGRPGRPAGEPRASGDRGHATRHRRSGLCSTSCSRGRAPIARRMLDREPASSSTDPTRSLACFSRRPAMRSPRPISVATSRSRATSWPPSSPPNRSTSAASARRIPASDPLVARAACLHASLGTAPASLATVRATSLARQGHGCDPLPLRRRRGVLRPMARCAADVLLRVLPRRHDRGRRRRPAGRSAGGQARAHHPKARGSRTGCGCSTSAAAGGRS